MTSPGEVVTVFTSPYLSAGAPSLGESKGLRSNFQIDSSNISIIPNNFYTKGPINKINLFHLYRLELKRCKMHYYIL